MFEGTPPPDEPASTHIARRWLAVLSEPARRVVADADLTAPHLSLHLPADSQKLRDLRKQLGTWLQRLDADPVQVEDVLLAVSEAATNAMEHAYEGDTHQQSGRVLVLAVSQPAHKTAAVVVADTGRWRPPPEDPGFRGRGLSMMRAVTNQFDLHHDDTGTTVVLEWTLR